MELASKGIGIAAITYDKPELLAEFAARKGVNYPLLGDSDSRMIRAFGILNDNFPPDHEWYGVPFPGTYLVDERGVVVAKYFEEDHRERFTTSGVLVKELGIGLDGRSTEVETAHLKLRYYASDETVRPGNRVTLVMELGLKARMHVYAPGVKGYKPIEWRIKNSTGWLLHEVSLPNSKMLHLPAIGETVPVYEGRFRITRDLTVGQAGEVRPLLAPDGTLQIEDSFYYQACDDRICYSPQTVPIRWLFRYANHDGQRSPVPLRKGAK
ncbi:MAG: redoxin domain-containing protein [Acidobacteria bacterium]|nr:redoxin domain-containing protein [Acidobacteriota bacterium]